MTDDKKKDIPRIAREAAFRYPFYDWFYNKQEIEIKDIADWRDVPILEKADLFKYEEICGEPYYGSCLRSQSITFFRTSGTLGRGLEIPLFPKDGFKFWIEPFRYLLKVAEIENESVTYVDDMQEGVTFFIKMLESMNVHFEPVPPTDACNADSMRRLWKSKKPRIALDVSGHWIEQLIHNGFPPDKLPIKSIICLDYPEKFKKRMEEMGIRIVRMYVISEGGFIGVSGTGESDFTVSPSVNIGVRTERYGLSEFGEGDLIVNTHFSTFPFINYNTKDLVSIYLDNQYRLKIQFLGRHYSVKIPDLSGSHVDINAISRYLSEKTDNRYIIIKCTSNIPKLPGDLLVSLVESEEVQHPTIAPGIQREIRTIGMGDSALNSSYLPTYFVPLNIIPKDVFSDSNPIYVDMTDDKTVSPRFAELKRFIKYQLLGEEPPTPNARGIAP